MNPKSPGGSLLPLLLTLFSFQQAAACGYAYVSNCSTTMNIGVDGAVSGYQVSTCPYLTVFNNHDFGTVNSLNITEIKSITWESCDNNVMNATFHYRIYEQSATPGAFLSIDLNNLTLGGGGAYRLKTREAFPNLNLLAGLNAGNYFIEIYLDSEVNFNNGGSPVDDVITHNNGGSNYKATFSISSGQSGSLTLAVVSQQNLSCNGDSNGSATVTTTNGVAPYTYAWSNGQTGDTASNLSAGTYSVTSTDNEGSTGSFNVIISQPNPLLANVSSVNETSASANNGSATASPSGGTPGYSYNWSNGSTTATITGLDSGVYNVTVTDNNGCTAVGTAVIAVSGTTPGNYCPSEGDFPWVDWITNVNLNTIDNASGKSKYSDFTSTATDLDLGVSYLLNIENGFSWQTYDEYFKVWIDYNRNGTFDEPGEVAFSGILNAPPLGTPTGLTSGTINIPATADEGTTRMRVAIKRGAYATPCETIPFGEVEDYTINLVNNGPVPCSISSSLSSMTCDDNGTNLDPNDDTFQFSILVNGQGTSAGWTTTVNGQDVTGSYGTATSFGPYDISAGAFSFTIYDSGDSTCTAAQSITPPLPCSTVTPCSISATTTSPVCHDNGTPNDPADDTYTFDLTVTGTNTSAGWTTTILGAAQSGPYGTATLMGPYPINQGDVNATIADGNDPACTTNISVTAPSTCSNGSGGGNYCASTSSFPWHDWIAGVMLENVDNTSTKTPYGDFTGLTANLAAGGSFPIALTSGFSWFTYDESWVVWIDYNQDGTFQEPGEIAFSLNEPAPPNGTLSHTVNGTVNVPATALIGPTRMRVSMLRGNTAPGPCETLAFGEVEDYTVNIAPQVAPSPLLINASPELESIDVYATVKPVPGAVGWQLEKSNNNTDFEILGTGSLFAPQESPWTEGAHLVKAVDYSPADGENYYRIVLTDEDGAVISRSSTALEFEHIPVFEIFPNPASGASFSIELSDIKSKNLRIEIYNQLGQPIYRKVIEEVDSDAYQVPIAGWRDGMYHIFLKPEGRRAVSKQLMVSRL